MNNMLPTVIKCCRCLEVTEAVAEAEVEATLHTLNEKSVHPRRLLASMPTILRVSSEWAVRMFTP